jgi:hypothetical protein
MNKRLSSYLHLTFFAVFFSCSIDNDLIVPEVNAFGAIDLGNQESSQDIYLRYSISFAPTSIRFVMIPLDTEFNGDQVDNLEPNQYMDIDERKLEGELFLTEILDVNGDFIVNRKMYRVAMVFKVEENWFIADKYIEMELKDQSNFIGDYTGTWDDNLHQNIAVSARIKSESSGLLSGEFFATHNFTPYADGASVGAENDGSIRIRINDIDQIELFQYNQDLPTYMDGCPGLYTGSGIYSDLTFEIDYEGEDCDGFHEGGKLILNRYF